LLQSNRSTFFRFVLAENLYYLSAIEWAASAMEMSAISGKNIANKIVESYAGRKIPAHVKDEL
jgi:hypothetical protein